MSTRAHLSVYLSLSLGAGTLAASGCASTPPTPVEDGHAHAHEEVTFDTENGIITVGDQRYTAPQDVTVTGAYLVDVGSETIVAVVHEVVEDDLVWSILAWRGGRLTFLGDVFLGNDPELTGDGRIESDFGNCGVSTHAVYRVVPGGKLDRKETSTGTYDPEDCAACPSVFREVDGRREMRGEIIRNLVGAAAERADRLVLDVVTGERVVVIELAEVKPETTYLDAIALDVDGVRVAPRECAEGGAACADDGVFDRFRLGERRRFTFDLPAGATPTALALEAVGYYVPFTPVAAPTP